MLSKGYGVASEYFAEILYSTRKESLGSLVPQHVELLDNCKIRDEKSFKRVAGGLLKLLFPNKQFDNNELKLVIDMALEYRQCVRDWLHKIDPRKYPNEKLSVTIVG